MPFFSLLKAFESFTERVKIQRFSKCSFNAPPEASKGLSDRKCSDVTMSEVPTASSTKSTSESEDPPGTAAPGTAAPGTSAPGTSASASGNSLPEAPKSEEITTPSVKPLPPDIGGYNVLLVTAMPPKYKCPLCTLLMKDALQTYRGEMACESCYRDAKGTSNICPLDKEPIGEDEFFKDMHARRTILQLPCLCCNKGNGCLWEGTVNEIELHHTNCSYKEISCTECRYLVLRKDLEQHQKDICKLRSVQCKFCEQEFNAQSLQDHHQTCALKPLQCPYKCNENVTLKNLYEHVQNCTVVMKGEVCPYQIVGCKYKPSSISDLSSHLQSCASEHASFTAALYVTLRQTNEQTRQQLLTEQTLRTELAQKMEDMEKEKSRMSAQIKQIEQQLHEVQGECVSLQEKCNTSIEIMKQDLEIIESQTENEAIKDVDKKLTELSIKFNELDTKIKAGDGECSATMGTVVKEELKEAVSKVDQLESGSAIISANLSDVELKLQLLENTCYDGRQIWKVDNVAYRMQQAVTGKVTALHSAPCFQKRGGYKFCSRLYLNGDGMGRGTHVSLFFVVMKSEYDALLQWPFSERVTFRLINPHNREETIQESFIPDRNSSSFKRPTKDMNIAAGCPMFIRKEKLQQFIVDDVLFIETSITAAVVA